MTRSVHLHRHDVLIVPWFNCPITLSNYTHDAYTVLLVLKSGWWWPITFEDFVVVWLKEWKEKKNELRISLWQADGLEEKGLLSLNSQINCWSMSRKSQSPFEKTWPRGARIWTNQSKKVQLPERLPGRMLKLRIDLWGSITEKKKRSPWLTNIS